MMTKKYLWSFVTAASLVPGLFSTPESLEASPNLPQAVETVLRNEVAVRWFRGDSPGAVEKLTFLLPRLTDVHLAAVDEWLDQNSLPSAGAMIVQTRLAMVQQNLGRRLPRPHPREVALVLPEIAKRTDAVLSECRAYESMKRPLLHPVVLGEYEGLLYELRTATSRLQAAVRMAEYAQELTKTTNRRAAPEGDASNAALQSERVKELLARAEEQELALRLQRLQRALDVLEDSEELKERLVAAAIIEDDGEWLSAVLNVNAKSKRSYTLAELSAPELPGVIAGQLQTVRASAGDLMKKSRLLRAGVQWWMRGRYGRGPEGFGLLKSELAVVSPQAQLALYMPPEMPKPNESSNWEESIPQFDRRHHYIWMFEYRRVALSSHQRATTTGETVRTTNWGDVIPVWSDQVNTEWTVVTRSLTPSDSRQVARLVGFLEYQNALACFDSLLKMSDTSEIAVYDELIRERPELAVHTNLSRRFPTGSSTLNEPDEPGATFERRGLRWLTALARVELAAMLAAFTSVQNPFQQVGAGTFDIEEYRELLLDGSRCHYWALQQDPALRAALDGALPDQGVLRYSRRLHLARAFLTAAAQAGQYTAPQYQELKAWYDRLTNADGQLNAMIASSLESPTVIKTHEYRTLGGLPSHVPIGLKFKDWPYDNAYPGFFQDMARISANPR
jgi:hypothetical protein